MSSSWGRLLLVMTVACVALPTQWASVPARAATQPDIIVFITDDMRANDWRVLDKTERLIGGVWYPNFVYTTPLCCPFRATLFTGQYAHNHGVKHNRDALMFFREHDHDTIATALDATGYHTALVGKYMNHHMKGFVPPGWDEWHAHDPPPMYETPNGYSTDVFRDRAKKIIKSAPKGAPLFLTVAFHAPHNPAIPAKRHEQANVGKTINDDDRQRKRSLLAVDEAVAEIAQAMGNRWNDSCVFFFTDNGFVLGEHGTSGKSTWWDGATRVPMRARCDGLGSGTDDRLTGSIDLAPTILHAGGASLERPVDGRALQDTWSRDGILIESWGRQSDGNPTVPFTGIKGDGWVYVEPEDQSPKFFRGERETDNLIGTLSTGERAAYAAWLADLEACAADSCHAAESSAAKKAREKRGGEGLETRQESPRRGHPDPRKTRGDGSRAAGTDSAASRVKTGRGSPYDEKRTPNWRKE
jgi:hypothetical protein